MSAPASSAPEAKQQQGEAKQAEQPKGQVDQRRERDFQAEREFQKTNTKLYLGNLPRHFKRDEVENLCQRYGTISDIMVNSEKRFAFVTYATRDDAQYAIFDLADKNVGGLVLHVSWSKPSEQQKQQARVKQQEAEAKDAKEETDKAAAGTQTADKTKATGKDATLPVAPVEEKEKERFSATQKVAQKKPQQPHARAPQHIKQQQQAPAKVAQHPPQQRGNQPAKAKPQAPKVPPPQRFKVTVQNETSGGDSVSLTISFEEWQKFICPLFENNKNVVVNRRS